MSAQRKFRYIFEAEFGETKIDPIFVSIKPYNRPTLQIEENEEKLPVKQWWEPMTITIFDTDPSDENIQRLYAISTKSADGDQGTVTIKLCDGCYTTLESWILNKAQFSNMNFGDAGYSTAHAQNIEITITFDEVKYTQHTGYLSRQID